MVAHVSAYVCMSSVRCVHASASRRRPAACLGHRQQAATGDARLLPRAYPARTLHTPCTHPAHPQKNRIQAEGVPWPGLAWPRRGAPAPGGAGAHILRKLAPGATCPGSCLNALPLSPSESTAAHAPLAARLRCPGNLVPALYIPRWSGGGSVLRRASTTNGAVEGEGQGT